MPSKKLNLRDHLEDNSLDLSMADLEEVPVRDIAQIKKATSLDLSNNRLTMLKDNFATLTHLTKLDLSKNQLSSLPENFGELIHLKSLDLYHNKLTHLPLSLGQLKALRWLDLKDNPLVPVLAEVAGPCLDRVQCQQCARKIVLFLQDMNEKVEIRKQEIIEKGRKELEQAEAVQKKEEAKKKKKLTKAEKKKENGMKMSQAVNNNVTAVKKVTPATKTNSQIPPALPQKKKESKSTKGSSRSRMFFKFAFTFTILAVTSLAILRSVNKEKFDSLHSAVGDGWNSFVSILPPQVVSTSQNVVEATQPILELMWGHVVNVGYQTVVKIQDGYLWLKSNEQSEPYVKYVESVMSALCDRASDFYRTVSRVTFITVDSVKKKVF